MIYQIHRRLIQHCKSSINANTHEITLQHNKT